MFSYYKPDDDYKPMPTGHGLNGPHGAWLEGFIKTLTKHCYTQNIKAVCPMVSEKEIVSCFSYCKSTGANDHRGVANLNPQGYDWQDFCRVPFNIATY